ALEAAQSIASGADDAEDLVEKARADFIIEMDDDFNSRAAIAVIFDLVRETNRLLAEGKLSAAGVKRVLSFLREMDQVFGILPSTVGGQQDLDGIIQIMIEVRKELRKRKAYDLADMIRDRLVAIGIQLEDTAEGAKWKKV
ncbi:MAG: cysteine--tRNA ligase, partial [Methanomassiliicoccales archaeon]|nr:cysteine--tRNA ligase [Methanomassiliicoccales archaeon]